MASSELYLIKFSIKEKVVFKYYIIIMVIKANVCCMHTCGPGAMPLNALWFYGI